MTAGLNWKPFTSGEWNDDVGIYLAPDYINYILTKDLKDKPGEKFFYNNRLMYLQGQIIEKSSGLSVNSFATKYLFNELGIKNYKWKVYDNGITETGGGLKMIPRDMMKFGLMYMNHGKWLNKQVISPEWVKSSTEKQISTGNQDYGYNWWIKSYSVNSEIYNTYYALGHGEQAIIVIPNANMVFVMTAGNYFQTRQRLDKIMTEYILPSLKVKETANKKELNINDLAGEYKINDNEIFKIEILDNSIIATDPAGKKFKLLPVSADYFKVENTPLEVKIITDEEGKVIAAETYNNGKREERLDKIKRK